MHPARISNASCPMALLRAPILTVTEEDDEWENCGCELFVAISYKHRYYSTTLRIRAALHQDAFDIQPTIHGSVRVGSLSLA